MLHRGAGRAPSIHVKVGRQPGEPGGSEIAVELEDGDVVRLHLARGVHVAGRPEGVDDGDRRWVLWPGIAVGERSCARVEQGKARNPGAGLVASRAMGCRKDESAAEHAAGASGRPARAVEGGDADDRWIAVGRSAAVDPGRSQRLGRGGGGEEE